MSWNKEARTICSSIVFLFVAIIDKKGERVTHRERRTGPVSNVSAPSSRRSFSKHWGRRIKAWRRLASEAK